MKIALRIAGLMLDAFTLFCAVLGLQWLMSGNPQPLIAGALTLAAAAFVSVALVLTRKAA